VGDSSDESVARSVPEISVQVVDTGIGTHVTNNLQVITHSE
jgi:hypothetical protein